MTREEEIKQAAKNRADQYEHPVDWNNCYHHYIQGVEWADQHPRKGLVDIEKACEWLSDYIKYFNLWEDGTQRDVEEFRKAMEE